jgi:hypothetical protein
MRQLNKADVVLVARKLILLLECTMIILTFSCSSNEEVNPASKPEPIEEPAPLPDTTTVLGNWTILPHTKGLSLHELKFKSQDTAYAIYGIQTYSVTSTGFKYSVDAGRTWYPEGQNALTFNFTLNKLTRYKNDIVAYAHFSHARQNYGALYFDCLNQEMTEGCSGAGYVFHFGWRSPINDFYAGSQFVAVLISYDRIAITSKLGDFKATSDFSFYTKGHIFDVVAAPADTSTLIIGSLEGVIWKTKDRGKIWREVLKDPDEHAFQDIVFWDNNLGFAIAKGSTGYLTVDGGELWQKITLPYHTDTSGGASGLEVIMVSKQRWFIAYKDAIYETADSGTTWTRSLKTSGFCDAPTFDGVGAIYSYTDRGIARLEL